jgi:hypothetical protein
MTVWEEGFLDDDRALLTDDGETVGEIKRVGGSWECRYKGEVIAIRPDKTAAQGCVSKMHSERG